jgi:tRNA-(ms[2]io[6]A)-hydroxylase
MLGLKANTNPEWVEVVLNDMESFMTDHAYNEIKASQSAIAVINHWPQNRKFVHTMSGIAIEEMEHFDSVYKKMHLHGWKLGQEQVNEYAMKLRKFFVKTKDKDQKFIQKLLLSSLIEARSCERFSLLKEGLKNSYPDLAQFYSDLFESEARHYRVFLEFARDYGNKEEVDKLWDNLLDYEASLIYKLGKKPLVHG